MDFTKFLNSKDIASYLRRIHYEFTPEQAMYVIHGATERPLSEKHAAYEELIERFGGHALRERRQGVFRGQTVASFLRTYMERENALLAELMRDGDFIAVGTTDKIFKLSPRGHAFKGHHTALTEEEMEVPLILIGIR